MIRNTLSLLCLASILILGVLFYKNKHQKVAYVDTIYLYQNADVQKHYRKLIDIKIKRGQFLLDSLYKLNNNTQETNYAFGKKREELLYASQQFEKDSEAKIWNQISEYTMEYGRQSGFDYIMGANGQGSIMFAKEGNNVSEEVLKFINKKFSDE